MLAEYSTHATGTELAIGGPFSGLKPTGSGKRKGQNPMKQLGATLTAAANGVVGCGSPDSSPLSITSNNCSANIDQIPLDLSLRGISAAKRMSGEPEDDQERVINKKVILSVPQYRKVHHAPPVEQHLHYTSSTSAAMQIDKFAAKNSLTITPVIKPELDNNCNEMKSADSTALVQRLLASHPQSFLAIQQLKQAATSILSQHQHHVTAAGAAIGAPLSHGELELRHSLWGSLIPSVTTTTALTVTGMSGDTAQLSPPVSPPSQTVICNNNPESTTAEEKKKVHKCDFSGCGKARIIS